MDIPELMSFEKVQVTHWYQNKGETAKRISEETAKIC